jgi:acetyltransferase-like isoleucine patch superfamily enzyme
MVSATPILVPLENVNDTTIMLAAWLVSDGEEVREGQMIAEMETSKAIIELPSPASGKITLQARPGDSIDVGAVIGFIGAGPVVAMQNGHRNPASASAVRRSTVFADSESQSSLSGIRFSKKALELIHMYGLSKAAFAGSTLVCEQDVVLLVKASAQPAVDIGESLFQLRGVSLNNVTLPSGLSETWVGNLDPDFYAHLSRNAQAFGKLSSVRKCREYAKHGASIGADVLIGEGSQIVAPRIVLGDGVEIGANSDIRCRESFSMGSLTSFRAGLFVRGGIVSMGQNVFAGSRIQIGGGGHADPWSLLCVGDDTFLGDDLFINICRPVVIGKQVFLTQRAMLVAHNVGHSVLEGYENCFEPIVLEDFCQVGMASTLYAGVRIGKSSIVASNSYVISSIPEGKLAIGVPARVVRDAARSIDRKAQIRIAREMVRDFRDLLKLKGLGVSEVADDAFSLIREERRYELQFIDSLREFQPGNEGHGSRVVWTLEAIGSAPLGTTIFNLLGKTVEGETDIFTDSAREFLRKRGIRFQPGPWRYRRGLI